MISAASLRGGAMGKKRKKIVTLSTVKGIAQDVNALLGAANGIEDMMVSDGIREVEFDGLVTINNAINQLNTSLLKLTYSVESTKRMR